MNAYSSLIEPGKLEELRMLADGSDELLLALLKKFDEIAATSRAEISAALAGGDWEALRKKAHSLKGASGNLGLSAVYAICLALEAAAKSENPATAAEQLTAFESAAGELTTALKGF